MTLLLTRRNFMNKVITDIMLKELQDRNDIRLAEMVEKMGSYLLVHKDNSVKRLKKFKNNTKSSIYSKYKKMIIVPAELVQVV